MSSTTHQTGSRTLNTLVLGVGGNVSQGIQKALAASSTSTRVVAACVTEDAAGLFTTDHAYLSPLARDPEFVPWLLDVCEREQIDAVLSGSEPVLDVLAPAAELIRARTGAVTIVSPPEVLRTGNDKVLTCQWLERNGLPAPAWAELSQPGAVQALVDRVGFPLVAKPRFGKSSSAVLLVRDERQLAAAGAAVAMAAGEDAEILLQEHLGDATEEFTVGCFCDREAVVRGSIVMRRRLEHGTTVAAELGPFPEVRAAAEEIVAALGPLGPCNVQLRMHHGRAVPFEINPRFSGTTAMRAHMNFNEVDAALRHFVLGEAVTGLERAERGVALRYWNELYITPDALETLRRERSLSKPVAEFESWGLRP